jgi:colicin import membrane protein
MAAMMSRLACVVAIAALGSAAVWAQADAPGAADERARIAAQRARVQLRFGAAQRECESRFAVTSCLNEAKAERRGALELLARDQAVLDDADRRQRAAERARRIQEKQRSAEQQTTDAVPVQARVRNQSAPPPAAATGPGKAAPPAAKPKPIDSSLHSAARAAKRSGSAEAQRRAQQVQAYQQRAAEAAAHRSAVEQRNAQRAAIKPPAAGLPPPEATR